MEAEFGGECPECLGRIGVGDEIMRADNGWVHVSCPDDPVIGVICPVCFLEKPCDCDGAI